MKSKMQGGLGFKDINFMNTTLLAKQAWHVVNNPMAL